MYAIMLCIAAATVGIEVGWQRTPEGGMEYLIQLDPQTLETLREGGTIQSDIPPGVGEVRSYRITVGAETLPRETPPPKALAPDPSIKPLAEHTAALMPSEKPPAAKAPQPPTSSDNTPNEPDKPWMPLIFTLLGLVGSLAANVYLGWIAWDFRRMWLAKSSPA